MRNIKRSFSIGSFGVSCLNHWEKFREITENSGKSGCSNSEKDYEKLIGIAK